MTQAGTAGYSQERGGGEWSAGRARQKFPTRRLDCCGGRRNAGTRNTSIGHLPAQQIESEREQETAQGQIGRGARLHMPNALS